MTPARTSRQNQTRGGSMGGVAPVFAGSDKGNSQGVEMPRDKTRAARLLQARRVHF
jgi:hypothetical protein